jgi:hypothetical protein
MRGRRIKKEKAKEPVVPIDNTEVQQKRIQNMFRDEKKFAMINFENLPEQTTFSLIDMIDNKQMNVRVKNRQEVTCSCMDWRIRGRKNKFNCKHMCYVISQILKLDYKVIEFNQVTDFSVIEAAFHRIKIDYKGTKPLDQKFQVDKKRELTEEDICPVCFVDFISGPKENLMNCGVCKGMVHQDCMVCWLKNAVNKTCVYCRDPDIAKILK